MTSSKSGEPSPESLARANRKRIVADEGRQAMVEVERRAVAVRDNMARLRALREAEERKRRDEAPAASEPPAKAPRRSKRQSPK
jgi:hypothetical protein